ncbi:MAG: nuclear transport factor 2 family protein [Pseudomonadales bacterium]|jgi:hypothetical protein|nr:nuclear transport factor 2 family protein [Pseudomonadales bacterium]
MTEVGKVPTLEELADRLAIQEVIHTYARGVDRADADILKSTCWEDSEVDYGGYKGPAHPFLDMLPDGLRKFVNTQHQVSNILVFLDGDSNKAKAETYLTAHHRRPDDTEMTYIGRYLDDLEKRNGVWKISFRKIVMTWHQDAACSDNFEQNASLVPIARATNQPDDPSHEFLS